MRLVLVFLSIVCLGVPVQTIKEDLLAQIVKKFQDQAGEHQSNGTEVQSQMAFVLFLPECQQANSLNDIGLGPETKIDIEQDMGEFHSKYTANPNRPFYLSAKPIYGIQGEGNTCSEYTILSSLIPGSVSTTVLQWLAQKSKPTKEESKTSCIIFYSTNTPCTRRCFNTNRRDYIVNRLKAANPFLNWKNSGAELIFAFQTVWRDADKKDTIQCFNELSHDWRFYQCSTNQDTPNCKRCKSDLSDCGLQPEVSLQTAGTSGRKRKLSKERFPYKRAKNIY